MKIYNFYVIHFVGYIFLLWQRAYDCIIKRKETNFINPKNMNA